MASAPKSLQGNLQMQKGRTKWATYIFKVTKSTYFQYFKDRNFSKPKGHVLLMEVKDVVIPSPAPEGSQFAFEVQLKSSSWILSASTDNERREWMEALLPGSTARIITRTYSNDHMTPKKMSAESISPKRYLPALVMPEPVHPSESQLVQSLPASLDTSPSPSSQFNSPTSKYTPSPDHVTKSVDSGYTRARSKSQFKSMFHVVATKNIADVLKDESVDPNARDDNGYTALHWFVRKPRKYRHELLMRCLESGREFDVNARDKFDWTPLHMAAQKDDLKYAQILIAFGADMFMRDSQWKYSHEVAPTGSYTKEFLQSFPMPVLHQSTCLVNQSIYMDFSLYQEEDDCLNTTELENMTMAELMQPRYTPALVRLIDKEITEVDNKPYCSIGEFSDDHMFALQKQRRFLNSWKETAGNRILFLDGGGIKGLVQIEVLMELERRTGCRVTDLFDWIVGTSTGAIVALGLVYARKSLSEMKSIYFQIKSKVFTGSDVGGFMNMNTNSQNLEEILKRELGGAPLNSIQTPKVMISVVNQEIKPLKLEFFNNFMTENEELTNIPVWMAARATSAAPALFTPIQDKYIDGGLKANNPCQEAMRVINEYDQSRGIPERHFLLAVSVGTGIDPDKAVFGGIMDKGMPLVKHAKYLKQLLGIFVDAISDSETPAQAFAAYCKRERNPASFFRFSPRLDEAVSPFEIVDDKIIKLILKTKQYLVEKEASDMLSELVTVFGRLSGQQDRNCFK